MKATQTTTPGLVEVTEPVSAISPGQVVFGRYVLDSILGRGGMGVVWRAHDRELDQSLALKFLPQLVTLDSEAVADLKRETRRGMGLSHPHIVRIHDFVQDGTMAAIAMEFVDGQTMSAMKVGKPGHCLGVSELTDYVPQLCEALAYAHHRAKIVHRDIKPANIMVNKRGELKINDFGISRSISDSLSRVSINLSSSGTPPYMSPQQWRGDSPTVSDDVYALGATIYDLLTGKPPFYSNGIEYQVMNVTPPPMALRREELGNSGEPIPAEWEEAVAACLRKDAKDRPATVTEVARMLGFMLPGSSGGVHSDPNYKKPAPPPVPKPTPQPQPVPVPSFDWKQWVQTPAAIAAVVALVAVVSGYGVYRLLSPDPEPTPVVIRQDARAKKDEKKAVVSEEKKKADETVARTEEKPNVKPAEGKEKEKTPVVVKPAEVVPAQKPQVDPVREHLLAQARGGNADAQFKLAMSLLETKNYAEAFKWARAAADQEHAQAQYALALMYEQGLGVDPDFGKAAELLKKSAAKGNADAKYELGSMAENGIGGPKSLTKARDWYQKAAEQGVAGAQNRYGYFLFNGLGGSKDINKARDWFEKAANQDLPAGQDMLGQWYEKVQQNYPVARDWYGKAADQNYGQAQLDLGLTFQNGLGCAQDYAAAMDLFQRSADNGNAAALAALGLLYQNGWGVAQNYDTARQLFEKSIAQGNMAAQKNLAVLYANGWGVEKDPKRAQALMAAGGSQGDDNDAPAQKRPAVAHDSTPARRPSNNNGKNPGGVTRGVGEFMGGVIRGFIRH